MQNQKNRRRLRAKSFVPASVFLSLLILSLSSLVTAQEWPDKIQGYKVFDAKVTVTTSPLRPVNGEKVDAFLKLSIPTLAGVGFTGATVEIGAEVTATDQSGRVDFVIFEGVTINGVKVDVEEYKHRFSFKKEHPTVIPKPVRLSLRYTSLPRAVYSEIFEHKSEIAVTGTAFVFGKFKKFGFSFKRVVPIKFNLKLRNPLGA